MELIDAAKSHSCVKNRKYVFLLRSSCCTRGYFTRSAETKNVKYRQHKNVRQRLLKQTLSDSWER